MCLFPMSRCIRPCLYCLDDVFASESIKHLLDICPDVPAEIRMIIEDEPVGKRNLLVSRLEVTSRAYGM